MSANEQHGLLGPGIGNLPTELWDDILWRLQLKDLGRLTLIKPFHSMATDALYRKDFILAKNSTDSRRQCHSLELVGSQERFKMGSRPLFWAIVKDNHATVRKVIRYGGKEVINLRGWAHSWGSGNGTDEAPVAAAAARGRKDILKLLLDAGADVNGHSVISDTNVETALGAAIREGELECMAVLLQRGAAAGIEFESAREPPPEDTSTMQVVNTALTRTALCEQTAMVKLILEHGKGHDIDGTNFRGWTGMHCAAQAAIHNTEDTWDGGEVMRLLAGAGANVNARSTRGDTPLIMLATATSWTWKGAMDVLFGAGADPDIQDNSGFTALSKAAERFDKNKLQYLVEHGADMTVGDVTNTDPWHLLGLRWNLTSEEEVHDCVKVLMDAGFRVTPRTMGIFLHAHAPKELLELIQTKLVDAGDIDAWEPYYRVRGRRATKYDNLRWLFRNFPPPADGTFKSVTSKIAWKEAILGLIGSEGIRDVEVVDRLYEYLDAEAKDTHDRQALMVLLGNRAFWLAKPRKLLDRLLEIGADVNHQDSSGKSCLHVLAELRYVSPWDFEEIVKLLVSKGADVNLDDNNDNTAMHLFLEYLMSEMEEIKLQALLQAGADLTIQNMRGNTPLQTYWLTRARYITIPIDDSKTLALLQAADAQAHAQAQAQAQAQANP